MKLTIMEIWGLIHGMGLGAVYLMAFAGGAADFWSLYRRALTKEGLFERLFRMKIGLLIMTVACWLTVITGTFFIYPKYRESSPDSPRSILLSSSDTALWHTFGMEWKEHVTWLSPILITAVLAIFFQYGDQLSQNHRMRRAVEVLFYLALFSAVIGGVFGALITKIAPIK